MGSGRAACPSRAPRRLPLRALSPPHTHPLHAGGWCGNIAPSGQCVDGVPVGGDDGCPVYEKRCPLPTNGDCKKILEGG